VGTTNFGQPSLLCKLAQQRLLIVAEHAGNHDGTRLRRERLAMIIDNWLRLKVYFSLDAFFEGAFEDFIGIQLLVEEASKLTRAKKKEIDQEYLGTEHQKLGKRDGIDIMTYSGASLIGRGKRLDYLVTLLRAKAVTCDKLADSAGYALTFGRATGTVTVFNDLPPLVVVGAKRGVFGRKDGKQYVKDDLGVLTRRYAWLVRPEGQSEAGLATGSPLIKPLPKKKLKGTYEHQNRYLTFGKLAKDRNLWPKLDANQKLFLAYWNYSNNGKLGQCLSSTHKKIRSNADKPFREAADHTLWTVDLAMIDPDVSVLVNLYADEAHLHGVPKLGKELKPVDWVAAGTVKNRELFCSSVPRDACTMGKVERAGIDDWH
jgi:hypothetical protein